MKTNYLKLFFSIILTIVLYTTLTSYSNTGGGVMSNNSQAGCNCHGGANANTIINVAGLPTPAQGYTMGQIYPVVVTVGNASKISSGINLSVTTGTITNLGAGLTAVSATSIRHSAPKAMVAGTVTYTFDWVAPTTSSNTLFLYASANATNGNGNSTGDAYNTYNLNVPLNINYLTFNTESKPNQVKLNWQTSTENKIKYFAIEKSFDGVAFDSVDKVIAVGGIGISKGYNYFDYPPHSGEYFYRLKIVDDMQNQAYSAVEKVNFDNGASLEAFTFPNPTVFNQMINLNIFNNKSKSIVVSMINNTGNEVYHYDYNAVKGTNYLRIPNQFTSGVYQIKVTPSVGKTLVLKHVIN
jgi:hypothetical protein